MSAKARKSSVNLVGREVPAPFSEPPRCEGWRRVPILGAVCVAIFLAANGPGGQAWGQLADVQPDDLQGVGIDEKLGSSVPLDLRFQDEQGRDVTLGDLFGTGRPVILSLNYSDCPMLCTLQLNGLVDALIDVPLTPGQDFEVLSVSIDPAETPQRARLTKQTYVKAYGRTETAAGWHFWVGKQASIDRLADAVGFRYRFVPERNEFSHAAALMICTPAGELSRYLYGVQFDPQTLKLSLIEASEGKIGSAMDQIILYCFHYDAEAGRYGPVAQRIMRLGAGLTLCIILIGLVPVWLRRSSRSSRQPADENRSTPDAGASSAAMLLLPLAQLPGGSFFFPTRGSAAAESVDDVFYFILWICVVFFAIIVGVMTYFVLRYRQRPGVDAVKTATHSNSLENTRTVIPTILVGVNFYWVFYGYMDMRQPPDNAYEIRVVAKKWNWSFIYPNGNIENNLHVPIDRPVQLVMSSEDVIHSLFIPAFRLKMDVVPGRYNKIWFKAREVGEYQLFCAEYCGQQHSQMLAKVSVHPSGEFESWLADAANFLERVTPEEGGEILYNRRGCVQCHSIDGSAKVGPSFKGSFGQEHALADGSTVLMDENYIRKSILEPQSQVRAGYKPVMPTYAGQIRDAEIDALIAFIKSLK
ncbi:MAG: cytochrome c oxidase subunit II [Planctomycetes bacterium]|nr:cytochrome c oxidase subunit II [Planctomycetota bacterium]